MDSEWYYALGNKQEGPVPERVLSEMLTTGKLPMTTLVWSEHLSNWAPAASVETFRTIGAATLPYPRPQPNNPQQPLADGQSLYARTVPAATAVGYTTTPRPWHRFFARVLDNWGVYAIPETIAVMILLALANSISRLSPQQMQIAAQIAAFFAMPFPFFIEVLCLSLIGATPGKLLLNIKVRNQDGSKLSFMQALQRTGAVWLRGGRLAQQSIPFLGGLVGLGLMVYQYQKLTKEGITSWDRNQNLVYEHGTVDGARLGGIIALSFFALLWLGASIALSLWLMNANR